MHTGTRYHMDPYRYPYPGYWYSDTRYLWSCVVVVVVVGLLLVVVAVFPVTIDY